MAGLVRRAATWVDDRTGLETALRKFLMEDIPGSAGWAQVFGSVALFLFITQAVTGVLLAFNYAPTPGEAYESLLYIIRKVAAGKMIHGLHHWGASLMIIVVFIHMAQVFIYGAYKKPREVTWIAGVGLLLLTLAFGLTGYLLPWDNRAYWGTMVTTKIIATAPIVGGLMLRVIGAANGIGVVTFSRFYALHTMVLPAVMVTLIALHVYLVRRHGVTPNIVESRPTQRFYPKQAFRDTVAIFISFAVLFAAAALMEVPLERLADPTETSYVPRPEWYFLFLFQLLKVFQGSLEPIGTIVLPSLTVLALLAVPFIDRVQLRRVNRRILATAMVILAFSAWGSLTAAAVLTSPPGPSSFIGSTRNAQWAELSPEVIAGLGYFNQAHCGTCHNVLIGDPKPGPSLASIQVHHPRPWLIQHFKNPGEAQAGHQTAPAHFSLPQLNALALFVENLKPDTASRLEDIPQKAIQGAQVFVMGGCGGCHKVNSVGGGIGPPLNGLADRRKREWVEAHFAEPQKLSPGSIMPVYHFSAAEEDAIVLYLFSLPE
jgi:ubiquinol-cytochrome c reductase cytochrome b subunit